MKNVKILFVLLLLIFFVCENNYAQSTNNHSRTYTPKDTTKEKKTLIEEILRELADSLNKPKVIPTEKNARIAYEFKQFRIFPSDDALEIIHILNPWLDTAQDTIATQRIVRMPAFPWITHSQRKSLRENLAEVSKPDVKTAQKFDSLATLFNNNLSAFLIGCKKLIDTIQAEYSINFYNLGDTLKLFQQRVLPALENKASELCKAKLQYYNSNLSEMVNIETAKSLSGNNIYYMMMILRDFFATAENEKQNENTYQAAPLNFTFSNAVYISSANERNYYTEIKLPGNSSIETKVIKCHFYVYDVNGNPINKRFHLYVAPYITIYNLENTTDTLGYIGGKSETLDAQLACTGTANLPNNSNWAIYCYDDYAKRTFVINQPYNYQNIIDRENNDNSFFKICLLYKGK